MSAGRSFHSTSGRVFWYDSDEADDGVADGLRGGPVELAGGRFTAAAETLGSGLLAGAGEAVDDGHAVCHWPGLDGVGDTSDPIAR